MVTGKYVPLIYIIRIDIGLAEREYDFMCPCRYILLNCNLSDIYATARELLRNTMG